MNQNEKEKLDEVVRKMAKMNLNGTKPTEAKAESNLNIENCDKHVTPFSRPDQFVDIAKMSEVTMENTIAMAEDGDEENGIDVSNIMQTSQFYIDDSKISRKKKPRR